MPSTRQLRVTFLGPRGEYLGSDVIPAPDPYSTPAAYRAAAARANRYAVGTAFKWEII